MLYEFPFISLLLANVFAAPAPDTNFPTTVVQLPQAPIHAKLKRHDHLAVPASDFNQFETRANDVSPYNAVLRPTNLRTQYTTEVSFNGISRYLLVDTGSSDTWMISQDFQCMNAQHKPVPRATCNLGDPYIGSVEPIRNQCFHLAYGSGETVTGTFGHADVDVAGVTVKKQQVVVVDKAFVLGDGVRAGLLGLGPRGATSAYRGGINSSTLQPTGELLNYQPVFESMYNRTGQVEGMFSLALERGAKGGYLAFGGLPPVAVEKKFTTTPLVGVNIGGKDIRDIYHAIQPKGYTLNGKAIGTNYTVTVDSGTAVNRLPLEMAERINAA